MSNKSPHTIRQLAVGDTDLFRDLLAVFGKAFEDMETYTGAQPSEGYLDELLGSDHFIAMAAMQATTVIGGLAAYELKKFETQRSEIYIYDLAVSTEYRRKGVATGLINKLRRNGAHT